MMEDFLKPLVRFLREDAGIQNLNTHSPGEGRNPILGPPHFEISNGTVSEWNGATDLWIFRGDDDNDGAPLANVEGTGSGSITLVHSGYWGRANRGTRLRFPEITVYYYADVTRDLTIGAPIKNDARDKILTMHQEVRRLLHIIDKRTGGYLPLGERADGSGSLLLVSSSEGRDVSTRLVPSGDGMMQGMATFEMEVLLR